MTEYKLEKWIWTDDDFNDMGWHDATVYGMRLQQTLNFDIDYIFQWNKPEIDELPFTFIVAPCTLVFENPENLTFELNQTFDDKWFEIDDIQLEIIKQKKQWNVMTQQGSISFQSNSFKQVVRRYPSFQFGQTIQYDERAGISFDTVSGEHQSQPLDLNIQERRKVEGTQFEVLKTRTVLKKEFKKLLEDRESGTIGVKEFTTFKKEMEAKLNVYDVALKGTRFENW